ncbi:type II secretion system protein GspM [Allosphingosinicella vermicomposti]|uniref:type II secretion system protein GspM n=1 Tax=Allosphingosinicella vermicomposti TaxID=614671 RepID=UPI000D107689|nr:type II secretion system protein GspM [Allosphingosinicella vermicomposti]
MMKNAIRDWWTSRTLREQRMLLGLALALGLTLGWLLIVRPLADARTDVLRRYEVAITQLAETRARAAVIRSLNSTAAPVSSGPVAAVVSGAATDAGFTIARLDSGADGSATLSIAAVRPQAFFAWIAELEARRGVAVQRLSATTNTDQTLSVQATFARKGG